MNEPESNIQCEHEEFLREIARKIRDTLVNETVGRRRFEEQVESCKKKYESYYDWLTSQHEAARAGPQLLDLHQGNSPKEKYVWEGAGCYWREPDRSDTPDVTTWFFPHWTLHWPDRFGRETSSPFKGERLPNDQERLMCYYVLLAIVHDNALAGPLTKPIYFTPYNPSGPYGFQEWANINLWKWLSDLTLYGGNHRRVTAKKMRDMLESALISVRTDVARFEPAETEQKATSLPIHIQNSNVILGDVHQPGNLQVGNHPQIQKITMNEEKNKGILKKSLKIGGAIVVSIIAAVVTDILGDFGWIESIKGFIYKIVLAR